MSSHHFAALSLCDSWSGKISTMFNQTKLEEELFAAKESLAACRAGLRAAAREEFPPPPELAEEDAECGEIQGQL